MKDTKIKIFKSIRGLTTAAMLTAISVVIGMFCKNFLNFGEGLFRITFENLPIILSGIVFGPVVGAVVGAVADILSYFLSTQTFAISPLVTLSAASVGLISGLVSHCIIKKNGNLRIIVSAVSAHIIGSMILKSISLFVYYQWAVLWRIPIYIVIAAIETTVICLLYRNPAFNKLINGVSKEK